MANPDGRVWIERHGFGRGPLDLTLAAAHVERVIRLVATLTGAQAHRERPIISAELPPRGERFEGVLPPVSRSPCFSIRKPAQVLFRLQDYVAAGMMSAGQKTTLEDAVRARANILIAGGTGSGKTTLANALLAEIAALDERVVILEDTRELACAAQDVVALRTRAGVVSLSDLVRSTLRLRPDRIIVGEVRGPEALDLLKAWNTGHPGGIATIHANSARAALSRLEQLCMEVCERPPTALIEEAIDLVVFIARGGSAGRIVADILAPKSQTGTFSLPGRTV
jgi:type IV secretion system protein VirB11